MNNLTPLNKEKLQELIKKYKNLINSNEYSELYKWKMVKTFQDSWNIDSNDFHTMLEYSLRDTGNLLVGRNYFPKAMLLDAALEYPEQIKNMFRFLFDEEKDLEGRIDYFQKKAKELINLRNPGDDLNTYQDARAIALYLNLRYPEKYYFYKYQMFKKFAELIKYEKFPDGRGSTLFIAFLNFASAIKEYITLDKELLKIHKSRLTSDCYQDDNNNLLTQDFIYSSISYNNEENSSIYPDEKSEGKLFELNTILYGPPGTGKTFNTKNLAIGIIENLSQEAVANKYPSRDEIVRKFNEYIKSEQIGFVTFHQSFSYEDFVEGIKPVLFDEDINTENTEEEFSAKIEYQIKPGIFKIIADKAKEYLKYETEIKPTFQLTNMPKFKDIEFYKMSLGNTQLAEDENIYQYCLDNNCIALGWGGDIDYSNIKDENDLIEKYKANSENSKFGRYAIQRFLFWMKENDIVLISEGNTKVRAIAKITGEYFYDPNSPIEYNHFRKVEWLAKNITIPISEIYQKKLSQQTIYQMLKSDIITEFFTEYDKPSIKPLNHVLIIDEINRGNIANILGELITLIEKDKRIGGKEELSVTLPYSKQNFSVPSNLYIIGTMNTADRSIETLDTALRRRFSFIEKQPNLDKIVSLELEEIGIDLQKMLKTINDRIEYLLDKDHVIGHAYFMNWENSDDHYEVLKDIFSQKIIPLLQEYFYNDYSKIGMILGPGFIEKKSFGNNNKPTMARGFDTLLEEYEEKVEYNLRPRDIWEIENFIGIYE